MTETETKRVEEVAFERATAGYELFGQKLEAFTSRRQAAAAAMGLRFGLVDEADIFKVTVNTLKEGKQELSFYNQMFADVVFVLWLCTVSKSRALRVLRRVEEAKDEAFDWADSKGISLTSAPYYQAAEVFFKIMQDISVSTVVPDLEESANGADESDPNE
jgi:hypothetical protein